MIVARIQENIIRCSDILSGLEQDGIYKLYKWAGGVGSFERSVRNISNESIDLRNQIVVELEKIIRASENKDLIQLIDADYFNKIAEASSKESLIRIVNLSNITLPATAMSVVAQDDKVVQVIDSISQRINSYNQRISNFRQEWNRFKLTLYSFPDIKSYPELIESQISMQSLMGHSSTSGRVSILTSAGSNKSVPPMSPVSNSKSPSKRVKNISSRF